MSKRPNRNSKSATTDADEIPKDAPVWLQKFTEYMLTSMKKMIDESTIGLASQNIEKLEVTTTKHAAMIQNMQSNQTQLNERIIKIESRSMCDNLIFCGIDEDGEQTLNEKLYTIIEDELNLSDINIVRCHRLPNPKRDISDDKPRNVVAKFADHADVQSSLSNARRLKVYHQYPKEIVARRRILQLILHAKGAKIKATLVDDRLYLLTIYIRYPI